VPDAVEVVAVDGFRASDYAALTFPYYQRLLLSALDRPRTIALGLSRDGEPVGLGLVELMPGYGASVRSLYVAPELRGRGWGTSLLARLEDETRAREYVELRAVYMAGEPNVPVLERILAKRWWDPSRLRMYVLRSNLESIDRARWMHRHRLGPDLAIFPWRDLTAADREALFRRQVEQPVSAEVFPFNFSPDFEPHTSLGVRHHGEVVGWVVNHRYDERTVRFTASYMREDLQKLGGLIAVYADSINRFRPAGYTDAIWTVPVEFPRMVAFARRALFPYATSISETRGSRKRL
jgi:ribosomal protein S18 acetylase RimI-like enzyme